MMDSHLVEVQVESTLRGRSLTSALGGLLSIRR
jgi:hypothetical protein